MRIKGDTVILYEKTLSGHDDFGAEIWTEVPVEVDNVLWGQPTPEEITDNINLYGKRVQYTLAIPKGDEHEWEDCKVTINGRDYKTFGPVYEGIYCNIPLAWNKKIMVERYE